MSGADSLTGRIRARMATAAARLEESRAWSPVPGAAPADGVRTSPPDDAPSGMIPPDGAPPDDAPADGAPADGATAGNAPAAAPPGTDWVSPPELAAERVRAATGRGWDEWRTLIDDAGLRDAGHTTIASWVAAEHGVDGWWAQGITVGYERITGLRLPGQMADGTFTANVGRTLDGSLDLEGLRALLLEAREDLFPAMATELRSRPTSRSLRIAFPEGSALISPEATTAGRLKVTVAHEKLPSQEAVERWKAYWRQWLAALADG